MSNQNFKVTDTAFWKSEWNKKNISYFHRDNRHNFLVKHFDKFINNRTKCKIFFPLCGKAVDMAWFASLGHEVVGVEFVETAVQEFYAEQNIPYSIKEAKDFKIYESNDKSIKLYVGDFFKFNRNIKLFQKSSYEGMFNAIWDRGSLVAITPTDRQKYSEIILELMELDCIYLIATFEYHSDSFPGPPHYVSEQLLNELYGKLLNVQLIDEQDENVMSKRVSPDLKERLYLLKLLQ